MPSIDINKEEIRGGLRLGREPTVSKKSKKPLQSKKTSFSYSHAKSRKRCEGRTCVETEQLSIKYQPIACLKKTSTASNIKMKPHTVLKEQVPGKGEYKGRAQAFQWSFPFNVNIPHLLWIGVLMILNTTHYTKLNVLRIVAFESRVLRGALVVDVGDDEIWREKRQNFNQRNKDADVATLREMTTRGADQRSPLARKNKVRGG